MPVSMVLRCFFDIFGLPLPPPSMRYLTGIALIWKAMGSTTEQNREVSSANKYGVQIRSSTRSFTYTRKNNGPKIEP